MVDSREHRLEALVGLLVVLAALAFVFWAWQRTGGGRGDGAVRVTAQFPSASGVAIGSDVRVAGIKVGQVAEQRLEPQSLQAELTLALRPGLRIPADSSAAIQSDGLLGSSHVALVPGGAPEPLKNGDVILETQGAVDMMSLIGGAINKSGSAAPAAVGEAGAMDGVALVEPATPEPAR